MKKSLLFLFAFTPLLSFAFPGDFKSMVNLVIDLIYGVVPLIAALALMFFFLGLAKFILNAGDSKSHAEGRLFMTWGLVGLFVMVSLWGIIRFAYNDFGFSRPFGIPTLPTGSLKNN